MIIMLAAAATGILQGYSAVARRTVTRSGMEDFGLFYASARQYVERGQLYGPLVRPGQREPSDARNLNPPHVNLLILPFGLMPTGPALLAWVLLNLCALADMVRIGVHEVHWRPLSIGGLASAVFLLAWAPTAALVITGQLALLIAWLVARAWRAARRHSWSRAGMWLGAAMSAKIFLLIFVPYLALRGRWQALRTAGLASVSSLLVGCLVFSPDAYVEWWQQFGEVTWQGHYMNASIWGVLARVLDDFKAYQPLACVPSWIPVVWAATASSVLVVTYWRIARAVENVDLEFTSLISASLLVSPLGWVYYIWLLVLPGSATALARERAPSRVTALVWCGIAIGLLWHASATVWLQPSALATITIASPYFWAVAAIWVWHMGAARRRNQCSVHAAITPGGSG
jgi:hypothetical protein